MRRVLFHFVFLTTVSLLAADKPWPVFAFQNGVHFKKSQYLSAMYNFKFYLKETNVQV